MRRVMLGNVPLERGRRFVLAALGLDGDDLCPVLQDKIDLGGPVGVVARLDGKLPAELLQNILYSGVWTRFEAAFRPQQEEQA